MAFDLGLEERIKSAFGLFPKEIRRNIQSKKMFGGLAILYRGKMTVGIIKNELIVRVVSEKMDEILSRGETRPMDFTNKPMKEFVYVSPEGFKNEEQLLYWLELGLEHAKRKLNN